MNKNSVDNSSEIVENKCNIKADCQDKSKETKSSTDFSKSTKLESKQLPVNELFKYADRFDILLYFIGIVSALICGVCHPVAMIFVRKLFDQFQLIELLEEKEIKEAIANNSIYVLVIDAVNAITAFFFTFCFKYTAERQMARIRYMYYKSILKQDISWFDMNDSKTLSTRVIDDTYSIIPGIGLEIGRVFKAFSQLITGYAIGLTGWKMSLVALDIGIPLCIIATYIGNYAGKYFGSLQSAYAEGSGIIEESISSIQTVASYNLEDYFHKIYDAAIKKAKKIGIKVAGFNGFSEGFFNMVFYVALACGLWYGGAIVRDDQNDTMESFRSSCPGINDYESEFGELFVSTICNNNHHNFTSEECNNRDICDEAYKCQTGDGCFTGGAAFLTYLVLTAGNYSLFMIPGAISAFNLSRGICKTLYSTIENKSEINEDKNEKINTIKGDIEFKNVKFTYPSRKDQVILKDLSLKIESGQTIGIVGKSGSGKSTIAQLIQRFYDPECGSILIDNKNIKDINTKSYRKLIGVVSQEPVLFYGTIKENIRYGNLECSDDDIIQAAKLANAHNFIMEFQQGYDTLVSDGGHSMSGGQKQRIAIARALVRNPSILILDEATSGLDSESEKIVQEALNELVKQKSRTTIIIAHKLSTIESADRIIVLNKGEIAEQGNHLELLKLNGIYTELCNKQKLHHNVEERVISPTEEGEGNVVIEKQSSIRESSCTKSDIKVEKNIINQKNVSNNNNSAWRLLSYLSSEKWNIFLGIIGGAMVGIGLPLFSFIFSNMLDYYNKPNVHDMMDGVTMWCIIMIVYNVLLCVGNSFKCYGFGAMTESYTCRIRRMCYTSLLKQDVGFYNEKDHTAGSITTEISTDNTYIKTALGQKLAINSQSFFGIITSLIIAFASYWLLTFVVCVSIPLIVFGTYVQVIFMSKSAEKVKKPLEEAGTIVSESVNSIRTVQSYGLEDNLLSQFQTKQQTSNELGKRDSYCNGIVQGYIDFITIANFVLGFAVGGIFILQGRCSTVQVMNVFLAMASCAGTIGLVATLGMDTVKFKIAAKSIFTICDRIPIIDHSNDKGEKPQINGEIELKDVNFSYKVDGNTKQVLKHFNLKIQKGQKIALVGSSGCGKSTIIGLLQRFYNADSGEILLDGHEIKSMNIKYLRKQFGLVGQEPVLFSGTIEENIKMGDYGNDKITHEDVVAAAKAANAHNFIMEFPDNYNTDVGNKGEQLSGGQKQRIAIARAILRNPKILLLDEATSALDTESETVVQQAIDQLLEGSDRTSIIVAHRLSTIQNADMIFVMDRGRVVEAGKHEQLMGIENGIYRNLALKQIVSSGNGN